MSTTLKLSTSEPNDYQIPVTWHNNSKAQANLIVMPAMGMAAKHYLGLADSLHNHGYNVLVYEQRGHGLSSVRADREHDWGYKEFIYPDLTTMIEWVKQQNDLPIYLCGHSIGGHIALISMGEIPEQFDGVVMITAGIPFFEVIPRYYRPIFYLAGIITRTLGYFPGHSMGFAGREAKTFMLEWLSILRTNTLNIDGMRKDLSEHIKQYTGPILNIQFADDELVNPAMNELLRARLPNAHWTAHMVDEQKAGHQADHFSFLKHPKITSQIISDWLKSNHGT